jgi:hypothetical protein
MITMQCSATDAGAQDVSENYKNSKEDASTVFVRTFAIGCVLHTWERNGYDDSDFFAIYWNEATQSVESIQYATTRGWTYANSATIDATPEVIEKALQYKIKSTTPQLIKNAEELARIPARGRVCRVIKGRKIKKGELVTVLGDPKTSKWNSWSPEVTTVLVKLHSENTMVHTNIVNLEVVNPEQYFITQEQAQSEADHAVRHSNWASMMYVGMSPRLQRAMSRLG